MLYDDGSEVSLGDVVSIPLASGEHKARVVMLGDTYAHLAIDPSFVEWVLKEHLLEPDAVVVEWVDHNPFAHNDQQYAPAGNFMFTRLDACITRAA